MTALIGTGHSIDQKNDDVKRSFRPLADITARFNRQMDENSASTTTPSFTVRPHDVSHRFKLTQKIVV